MRIRNTETCGFESLEDRICLTVSAGLENGWLEVTGIADGQVQITGTDSGLDVLDDGQLIGSFTDVDRIRVLLDVESGATNDDVVRVNFNDQTVDRLFAFLGDGNNIFDVSGNLPIGSVGMVGGQDIDVLNVNVVTENSIAARLQAGNDRVNVNADTAWLFVSGGDGSDAVNLAENATAGAISARLGQGDNIANIQGDVTHRLGIMGEDGNDTFTVAETADIGGRVTFKVGNGDNVVNMLGESGNRLTVRAGNGVQDINIDSAIAGNISVVIGDSGDTAGNDVSISGNIGGDVFVGTGNGNDIVSLDATIAQDVSVEFGSGGNSFSHTGRISGDLEVVSRNPDDVFVAEGSVGGDSIFDPGGQNNFTDAQWRWGWVLGSGWGWTLS